MVTHDRYFLDKVTNKIVEIDRGKLYSYLANYSKFVELKAQRDSTPAMIFKRVDFPVPFTPNTPILSPS